VYADQAAVYRPGADRHVKGFQCLHKFSGFLDWRRKISVREKCDAPARFFHAMPNAVAFTSINVIRNHAQRGNLDAKIFGHRGSAILRAVVHHQNFGVEPSGRKVFRNPL